LEKTWSEVPAESKAHFDDLTEIFSQEQNQKIFREILIKDLNNYADIFDYNDSTTETDNLDHIKNLSNKIQLNHELEGTSKYADINSGINATLSRKMKERILQQQLKNQFKEPLGTVPFLGTFLKDLEYIHAQYPTKNEKGQINVMKKRKEFEIIAQIKLLQQASYMYNIIPDPNFNAWLHQQPSYTEKQNYEYSYLIEPKSSSLASRSESINSVNSVLSPQAGNIIKTPLSKSKFDHSLNSSYGSSDMFDSSGKFKDNWSSSNTSTSFNEMTNKTEKPPATAISSSTSSAAASSDMRVKVNVESDVTTVVYKLISITDKLRTKDVKRLILEKFFLNPDSCDKYTLVQLLSNNDPTSQSELIINDNCNVYYAAKNMSDMQFLLKLKSMQSSRNQSGATNLHVNNSNSDFSSNNKSPSILNSRIFNSSNNITKKQSNQPNIHRTFSSNNNNNNNNNKYFDQLPPKSPNGQQSTKQSSSSNNSNSSWQLFKKILS
jgi:hypothetical protein